MILNLTRNWVMTVRDVTGSRALDTNYTNTTGRTIFVQASIFSFVPLYADAAYCDGTASSISLATAGFTAGTPDNKALRAYFPVVFSVPPGAVYNITKHQSGDGIVILYKWVESY